MDDTILEIRVHTSPVMWFHSIDWVRDEVSMDTGTVWPLNWQFLLYIRMVFRQSYLLVPVVLSTLKYVVQSWMYLCVCATVCVHACMCVGIFVCVCYVYDGCVHITARA